MKKLFAVGLGHLVATFIVAFCLAVGLWGTQGGSLVVIVMALFPLLPLWFAASVWLLPLVAYVVLLLVTWRFFAWVLGRFPEPWGRIAAAVAAFAACQVVAALVVVNLLRARFGAEAAEGAMLVALVLQLVLAMFLSIWNKHLE
jgi:hypothetical protein